MISDKSKAKFGMIASMLLLATLAFVSSASTATIYVPTDYPSIQQAIDAASPGDTVFVYNGTYYEGEGVSISKERITLQGEDANTTIIPGKWTAEKVVYVTGNYVNVSGFTVTNSTKYGYGIYIVGDNCLISDNVIDSTGYGICLHSSSNCRIENNIANSNRYGIELSSSSNCNVTKNTANSNAWNGIRLYQSSNCKIENNIANSNRNDCSICLHSSSNCRIENNIVNSNRYGIELSSSSNCNVTNNIVDSNDYGVCLGTTSTDNNITENNITNNNEYGMYLDWSGNNEIYHNNFIDNNKQAYDHHGFNNWDKGQTIGGNYWNDHICHGNPSNGTEPYTKIDTDAGAVDNYPFEDPDGWVIPPPPLPDLAISSADISFSPEPPIEGEIVIINATIHNIGGANASNVVVRFFDGGEQIGTDQVIGFIGIGGEETVSVTWNTTGEAGEHIITVKVDPDNEIEERDETNNEAPKPITVEPPLLPTISITTDEFEYSPSDIMTITIDIANPTEDSVMFQWYWGVPRYRIWIRVMSAPIPAGYNDTHDFSFTIPNWSPKPFGNVFYVQLLDASGEVLDADAACWTYSPGEEEMPTRKVGIAKEIKKIIKGVELPS